MCNYIVYRLLPGVLQGYEVHLISHPLMPSTVTSGEVELSCLAQFQAAQVSLKIVGMLAIFSPSVLQMCNITVCSMM